VTIHHCKPRPEKQIELHDEARPRTAWNVEASIFKDYKIETLKISLFIFILPQNNLIHDSVLQRILIIYSPQQAHPSNPQSTEEQH
jgi:hypothetical protein